VTVLGGVDLKPLGYDESRWPFVVLTLPENELTDGQFAAQLEAGNAQYARGQNFGLLVDVRKAELPSAARRRMIAENLDDNRRRHGPLLIGVAVVMSSSVARGAFRAIQWLRQNPDPPMSAFDDVDSALAWLRERYQAAMKRNAGVSSARL
jgi:hypothetical protein